MIRRALMIVALCLFAWAATASAECAWVLWSQAVQRQTGQILAAPMRSFDNRQECERVLFQEAKEYKAEHPDGRLAFVCVPDTVDPRGPKGK